MRGGVGIRQSGNDFNEGMHNLADFGTTPALCTCGAACDVIPERLPCSRCCAEICQIMHSLVEIVP